VVDSDSATWAQNAASGTRGFTVVKGYPWLDKKPTPTPIPAKGPLYAVTEDKSSHNVLIWVDGNPPRGMQDVLNYHLEPGWKGSLKITIPADGRITFVAGDGSKGPTSPYDKVLTTCVWTGDPKDTSRLPYVTFDAGEHLVCGTYKK
jgi:hypothetical protein